MSHAEVVQFTGTWGLVYMMAIFAVAAVYALWPRNRAKFERARHMPLDESDHPAREEDR